MQPVSKMRVRIEWSGPSLFEAPWPEKHVAKFSLSAAECEITTSTYKNRSYDRIYDDRTVCTSGEKLGCFWWDLKSFLEEIGFLPSLSLPTYYCPMHLGSDSVPP